MQNNAVLNAIMMKPTQYKLRSKGSGNVLPHSIIENPLGIPANASAAPAIFNSTSLSNKRSNRLGKIVRPS
jgi:hypothetical protein